MSNLSLFIPRVFLNISEERIRNVFSKLKYGKVSHVEFVRRRGATGDYNSAYIYFEYWFDNPIADDFKERVKDKTFETPKIVYDAPWYWVVLPNTSKTMAPRNEEADVEYLEEEHEDKDKDEEEDEELNTILDQMDEASEIIPEATTELVSSDYVERLELDNQNLKNNLKEKTDSYRRARVSEEFLLQEQSAWKTTSEMYIHLIKDLEQERMELQSELAHMKELLAQYQPDIRYQNKELYH